jgi:hypothetical protein
MKARLWLVLFVLLFVLLVAGSFAVPATLAQGQTYWTYLPLLHVPPAVHVLSNYAYRSSMDSLHIVGEVENRSGDSIYYVKVIVDFYDANHHLVANDYTYLFLDNLPTGDKSCYHLVMYNAPSYASYEFEPVSYDPTTVRMLNLTLVDPSASYEASTGAYRIIGLVRNDGAVRVNNVDLVGTAYNEAGTVVGCSWAYVNSNDLDPGQSSSFLLGFSGRDEADVASWRLQLDGSPQ